MPSRASRRASAARRAAAATALIACAGAVPLAGGVGAPRSDLPRVRVESVATFDSYLLPEPGAWSPAGARLALLEAFTGHPPTRVAVFDAGQPGVPPRGVYEAGQWIRSCGWSPDGTWLLVLFGAPSPGNRRWLVAVPADGASPETLLAGSDVWPAAWGPDGDIHVRAGGRWRALAPPARWKAAAAFTPRGVRAASVAGGRDLRLREHSPGSNGQPLLVGAYFASTGEVRVLDALPDGSRTLVSVADKMRGGPRLVDGRGRTLLDLRRARIGFEPTAISADGAWIAGFGSRWRGEERTDTWLEAADATAGRSARVEGGEGGHDPQLSRAGSWIAFRSGRGTRVGRLVVERP